MNCPTLSKSGAHREPPSTALALDGSWRFLSVCKGMKLPNPQLAKAGVKRFSTDIYICFVVFCLYFNSPIIKMVSCTVHWAKIDLPSPDNGNHYLVISSAKSSFLRIKRRWGMCYEVRWLFILNAPRDLTKDKFYKKFWINMLKYRKYFYSWICFDIGYHFS